MEFAMTVIEFVYILDRFDLLESCLINQMEILAIVFLRFYAHYIVGVIFTDHLMSVFRISV